MRGQAKIYVVDRLQHTKVVAALTLSPSVDIGEPDMCIATRLTAVFVSQRRRLLLDSWCECCALFETCL